MDRVILTTDLRFEQDIVLSRQRARQIAALLGFDGQDQTRIATAVSEIARNAYEYARGGKITFSVASTPQADTGAVEHRNRGLAPGIKSSFVIRVADSGPGMADLQAVLDGRYHSPTGMGLGITGARRLTDDFQIESAPGKGTTVYLAKTLPPSAPPVTAVTVARLGMELARSTPDSPLTEVLQQNQELILALDALRARQTEVERLNRELEDTNRGVVALYTELDEKAGSLRRAAELKTSFLSNMSHEFRTPLNAVLSLSQLLLDRIDGELTVEQETQVSYIRKAATDLSELVDDLLDLARVEAGKVAIRPTEFAVDAAFGALRGMLRTLLTNRESVSLTFEDALDLPPMFTDEGKVSQILRNLISNALKFTESGEVRVSARAAADNRVLFAVADTGIGIAARDRVRIFEEFVQVDGPIQKRVKGTGLGLPLSRKLTELLGGRMWVESEPGRGSTFFVELPSTYTGPQEVSVAPECARIVDPNRTPVLVVEDNAETLLLYDRYFKGTEFQLIPAKSLRETREALALFRPLAVLLDIPSGNNGAWSFLAELRTEERTSDLPVIAVTDLEDQQRARALGATSLGVRPVERNWLLDLLRELNGAGEALTVLIIDDDEISRYLLRGLLASSPFRTLEASSGEEGLALARRESPNAIFLDLVMPGMDGFETLARLRADPSTRETPVIINTSSELDEERTAQLSAHTTAILDKRGRSRDEAATDVRRALALAGVLSARELQHG